MRGSWQLDAEGVATRKCLSGLLLMAADFEAYVASTAFWIKMGLMVALVINGAVLARAGVRITASDTCAVQGM